MIGRKRRFSAIKKKLNRTYKQVRIFNLGLLKNFRTLNKPEQGTKKKRKEILLELKEYNKLDEDSVYDTSKSISSSFILSPSSKSALYIAKENNFSLNIEIKDEKTRKSSNYLFITRYQNGSPSRHLLQKE